MVVVTTVVDVLDDVLPKISDISIDSTPCCCNSFSILSGVVDTVGHPVNSVVALKKTNKRNDTKFQIHIFIHELHLDLEFIFYENFYRVGNPLRMVISGGAGPPACSGPPACGGRAVVNRTPGRFPIPFGNTNLKLEFEVVLFDAAFSCVSTLFSCSESVGVVFALNPGGNKLLISTLNDNLFNTLCSMLSLPVSDFVVGISVVVVVDFGGRNDL